MTGPAAAMDQTPDQEQALGLLVEELTGKLQAGEKVDLAAFVEDHPEYEKELQRLLPALAVLADLGQPGAALEGVSGRPPNSGDEVIGTLGDFRILREVGRGGMGIVYEALQISLGRRVALKVLPFANALDAKQLQRFKNEAQAAALLHHQSIVPVYAVGSERGMHYYAMQFIDGHTLAALIQELRQLAQRPASKTPSSTVAALAEEVASGKWAPVYPASPTDGVTGRPYPSNRSPRTPNEGAASPAPASAGATLAVPSGALSTERCSRPASFFRTMAHLGLQAAEALEHAHQLGVVHRDIKPANLLVDGRGHLWITDFGLAHCQSQAGLTMTGDLVGTLRYMSPEQALAQRVTVDHRTDVYSLGATLYELLTLKPAFGGKDRQELLRQIAFDEPRPLRRLERAVPAELETIVLKAMAKNPGDRYGTAQQVADDLRRFLENKPIRARRPGLSKRLLLWVRRRPAVAALLAVSALAALAVAGLVLGLLFNQKLQSALNSVHRERYLKDIALANAAWQDSSLGRLELLLDDCPPDYRNTWEWRYLKRQCHAESLTLTGYDGGVMSLVYNRDGKRLFTGSLDGIVKVWDTATGRELFALPGHRPVEILRIALSPDGNRLASASSDKTVKVWDLATRQSLFTLKGHTLDVAGVAFSPDGKRIATGSWDKTVRVWDAVTGREVFPSPLKGHDAEVYNLAFSPDGKHIASVSVDKTVRLWDTATGRPAVPPCLQGHTAPVNFVAFSPDGKWLATGAQDRTVRIWDAATGESIGKFEGHTNEVFSVAFSPDSKRIASTGGDRTIRVWNAAAAKPGSGNPLLLILRGHGNTAFDVAFSPDGTRLASGSQDRTVKIWNATISPEAQTLTGHDGEVTGVAFSPDGKWVVSSSLDRSVKVWEAATGQCVHSYQHEGGVAGVAFSPDGRWIASASADQTVKVWDLARGQPSALPVPRHSTEVRCVAFSSDGTQIASGDMDGVLRVWLAATGQELLHAQAHRAEVRSVAFNSDATQLASAGADRIVKVWNLATGQMTYPLEGHHCWCHGVAFSPDSTRVAAAEEPATEGSGRTRAGPRLASASGDGAVRIWDVATGRELFAFQAHGGYVRGLAFSPDGSRLATAATDCTLKLWDVNTGQEVLTLSGHNSGVTSVAFSADGSLLVSGDMDGRVKLWDAQPWNDKGPSYIGVSP